ncbi:MAG: hypothetical protein V1834_01570 [Candidatus Micrarchaeota archaeon]
MKELRRQTVHLVLGLVFVTIGYFLGSAVLTTLLFLALASGLFLIHYYLRGFRHWTIHHLLVLLDRPHWLPAKGALFYVAGALFLLSFMEFSFALGVLAIVAAGDGLATIVGRHSKVRLPYRREKSVMGLVFFVLGGFAASVLLLGFHDAVIYSIALGLVEAFLPGDDNLLIPLSAVVLRVVLP